MRSKADETLVIVETCLLNKETFAKNSSFGFSNSADMWRSSFAIVF